MTDQPFRIQPAQWPDDAAQLREIRERVFVDEQQVPLELEWDGRDPEALHLLAWSTDSQPIGTARLLPDGQIGRMAVLPAWRRRGVGGRLLLGLLELAAQRPDMQPFLNAQTSALGFYRRFGFTAQGEEFMEAGIPHLRMILSESHD